MKKLQFALTALLFTILLSHFVFAQDQVIDTDDPVYCLNFGIKAESREIRKASFFTLAKEKKKEVIPVLIDCLFEEKDEELRLLIARVIYRFDEVEGLRVLENIAWNDNNLRVRYVCAALCQSFFEKHPDKYEFEAKELQKSLQLARNPKG